MKDQELVNALREHADWWENGDMMEPLGGLEKDLAKAADLIEAQAKEIEGLRSQNEQLREAAALVAKESAELLERNYLMSIIADIRKAGKTWMCQYCAHCKGIVSGMADCDSKMPCVMPYGQFELKRPEPPEAKSNA